MRNGNRPLSATMLALAVLGCAAASQEPAAEPRTVTRPAEMARSTFELRPVLEAPSAGALELPDPEGVPLHLGEPAPVGETDIARVEIGPAASSHQMVLLHFQPAAAKRLYAFTAEHIGSRVAILVDGKILMAPEVHESIGATLAINPAYSEDDIVELAQRLAP